MVLDDKDNIPLAWAYLTNEETKEITEKLTTMYEIALKESSTYHEVMRKQTPQERDNYIRKRNKIRRFEADTANMVLKVVGGKKGLNFIDYGVTLHENSTVQIDFGRLMGRLVDAQQKFDN